MDTNIEIGLNPEFKDISNTKLLEILKENGIEKTQGELDVLSKILADKGKGTVS
jgi:Na+-translocating ferredoxin:NAD+ oxidoreductase RnfC subunit